MSYIYGLITGFAGACVAIVIGYFLGRKKDSPVIFPADTSVQETVPDLMQDLMEGP